MHASKGPNGASYFRNVVMDFCDEERESSKRLPVHEREKIRDLRDDVEDYEPQLEKGTVLGCAFARFERLAGLTWPYWLAHPLRWVRHKRRTSRKCMDCHPLPKGTDHATMAFADDFFLFDRLSLIYGGKFRGSIVVNYFLGILASGTLVLSLTIGSAWSSAPPGDPYWFLPIGTSVFELICLVAIGFIYCKGATPETEEHRPSWAPRWTWQRWHQRWLEYRLIAERFRYLDLLLPFGAREAARISIAPGSDAEKMWHQQYFEWRIANAVPPGIGVREYHRHVAAVMIAQERYHALNYVRRGKIADGLHTFAVRLFLFGLALCIWNLSIEGYGMYLQYSCIKVQCADLEDARKSGEHTRHLIVFLAALFPILSAAIHGVLANTEYTKVADTSGEVAHRIHELVDEFSDLPVPNDWDDEKTLVPTRNLVREFVELVINEATGWRAMLRDKNVPLA